MSWINGGDASKLGNRYEAKWVVRQCIRLLREEILSFSLESIGDDNVGVDVWVTSKDGVRTAYQCKGRDGSNDHWTIGALSSVIEKANYQLQRDRLAYFRLVSPLPYIQLSDLAGNARKKLDVDSVQHFEHLASLSKGNRDLLQSLGDKLGIAGDDPARKQLVLDFLKRFDLEGFSDQAAEYGNLTAWLDQILTEDAEVSFAVLRDYVESHLAETISVSMLVGHLSEKGIHSKNLTLDNRIVPAISTLQEEFFTSLTPDLINGTMLGRTQTQHILDLIPKGKIIVLKGSAGSGKSGVLYEVASDLKKRNVLFLPLRLDRRPPSDCPRTYGISMGLPDSPSLCLTAISGNQPCVLILDQIDALRWTSGACNAAFEVCMQLVKQCLEQSKVSSPVSVILSVRQVDLDNHPGLKSWLGGDSAITYIDIPLLTEQEMAESLKRFDKDAFRQLSVRQKSLLQSPHLLHMWMTIARDNPDVNFQSGTSLIRAYLHDRRKKAVQLGANERELADFLDLIVTNMDSNNRIWAPSRLAENFALTFDRLQSVGLLRESAKNILFSHQSYLDYQVAYRVLSKLNDQNSLVDWLGEKKNQHLLKREQLKLILSQLAEEDPQRFINESAQLVQSMTVRFHLKHLVLVQIAQEVPTPQLADVVLNWLLVQYLEDRVIDTIFFGHPKWIAILDEKELLGVWIDGKDSKLRQRALYLLRSIAPIAPEIVVKYIRRLQVADSFDTNDIAGILPYSVVDKAGDYLPVRLNLLERGVIPDYFDWHELGESYPKEAIEYFAFLLSKVRVVENKYSPSCISWEMCESFSKAIDPFSDYEMDGFNKVADAIPSELWESCIEIVTKLTTSTSDVTRETILVSYWSLLLDDDVLHCAFKLLIRAGKRLAQIKGAVFFLETMKFHNIDSPITDLILAEVYRELPSECSDRVLDWLFERPVRLTISKFQENISKWQTAANLIQKHATTCSDIVFYKIERFLVFNKPPMIAEKAKRKLESHRKGNYSAFWGDIQHALLPMLPSHRISETTQGLLGVLVRRDEIAAFNNRVTSRIICTSTTSPVHDKAHSLSDKAWLNILRSKKMHKDDFWNMRQIDEEHAVKSDIESFSYTVRTAAERNPTRFIKLSMKFPPNTDLRYIEAIASVTMVTKLEPDSKRSVIKDDQWHPATREDCIQFWEKFFSLLENTNTVRDFCLMMQKRPDTQWPNHFYEQLARLALSHADPVMNIESYKYLNKTIETVRPSELTSTALNSVRGVAAETIADILWHFPDKLPIFKNAIDHLARDPHPAVRLSALHIFYSMLKYDPDQAVAWYCEACRLDPRVPSTRISIRFFNQTIPKYLSELEPIIRSMIASPFAEVAQYGAAEATARYLFHGCFEEEYLQIRQLGTIAHKKGIVESAVALVQKPIYFERCVAILSDYTSEKEKDLCRSAHRWITEEVLFFGNAPQCLEHYVADSVLQSDNYILHQLNDHKASILPFRRVIMKFVNNLIAHLQVTPEITKSWRFHHLPNVLLRLYEESQAARDIECVDACLDAWDRLFEVGFDRVRDLSKELSSYLPKEVV